MSIPLSQANGGTRLKELDGWRAISVSLVIVDHFCAYQHSRLLVPHAAVMSLLKGFGSLGVKIFFVISGFVICRLLLLEEKRFGRVSLKAFYVRRVCRILPPFYLYCATVSLLFALGLIESSWRDISSGALFLYDFVPRFGGWFVGHSWTLAVEEQFYLVFPALWILTRRIGRVPAFLSIFLLLVAWNISAGKWDWDQLTIPPARAGFPCISCGVLMAILESRARAFARKVPALVVVAAALALLWHPEELNAEIALYESVFMPLAIALLLAFSLERGRPLRTFLCSKPVQAVGVTSYGIYLWQELFTAPKMLYRPLGKPIAYLLPLLLLIVPLSYRFIEKPAMRLGKRFTEQILQKMQLTKAAA